MGVNVVNGQPARYLSSDPTLTNGQGSALRVNVNGYLLTAGGTGSSSNQVQGTAADNAAAVGNPVRVAGRYESGTDTYADGDIGDLHIDVNGNLKVTQARDTAVVTSVNDSASSVTLVAASTTAKARIIQNDSTSILYAKFGTTATTTDYTVKLSPDDVLVTEYVGRIDGIWSANASGAAKITELS